MIRLLALVALAACAVVVPAHGAKPKPCPKKQPRCHAAKPKPKAKPAPPPPPVTTTTPAPPAPAPTAYIYDDAVTPDQKADIEAAVANAQKHLDALGVPRFHFDVYAEVDADKLAADYAKQQGRTLEQAKSTWVINKAVAIGAPGAFFVHLGDPLWPGYAQGQRWKILAHELFHVAQHWLVGGQVAGPDAEVPLGGPRWLLEGSAEQFGQWAAAEAGIYDREWARAWYRANATAEGTHLNDLITQVQVRAAGLSPVIDVGTPAVEYLAPDPKPLVTYFATIKTGKTWQQAFQQVFGRTIDDFVAAFEAYRTTW